MTFSEVTGTRQESMARTISQLRVKLGSAEWDARLANKGKLDAEQLLAEYVIQVEELQATNKEQERLLGSRFRSLNNHRMTIKSMRGQVERLCEDLKSKVRYISELENQG